jgi:SAM-dependent methyltransferase
MDTTPSLEEIAAAAAYESLHVPALFREWAPWVADAAGIVPDQSVIDVACGTGVLAREAALRLANTGSVTGLDPSPGMLAVAAQLAPEIQWREGVAEALPFPDDSFDVALSQFGLMFFQDRALALQEMMRVLRPGGMLVVAVWESLENSEAYPLEVELLGRVGGEAAADALRAPFTMGDRHQLAALFTQSGAASVDIATRRGTARFPSIRTMVEADLRGWLPVMGVNLMEEQIEAILEEAERVLAQYVTDDGSVQFDAPGHIVSWQKPEDLLS